MVPELQPRQAGEVAEFRRDRAGELVVAEVQLRQACEVAEFGRDRARELATAEKQPREVGEVAEFGRDRAREAVCVEQQPRQACEVTQFGRDRAGELVVAEVQLRQACEVAEFGRDPAGELVVAEVQLRQACEVAEFGRDRAGELVTAEKQPREVGEVAEFGRDGAGECVTAEQQPCQVGEVAEFRGDGARQIVVFRDQTDHAAFIINPDAVPLRQRCSSQPVPVVEPIRPPSRFIEQRQEVAVRQRSTLDPRALVRRNGVQPGLERCFGRGAESCVRIVELCQGEPGQGQRKPTRKGVVADPHYGRSRQVAQRQRKLSLESVPRQIQLGDPAEEIRADAVPVLHETFIWPAAGLGPAGPARRLIQGLERHHVGRVAERRPHGVVVFDCSQPGAENRCPGHAKCIPFNEEESKLVKSQ